MKYFLLLFFLIFMNPLLGNDLKEFSSDLLINPNKTTQPVIDNWFGKDKARHLIGSFISTGASKLALKRFVGYSDSKSSNIALSFSFSLGLAKEIYDGQQSGNIFSYKDITANFLGSFLAYLVIK